MSRFGVSTHLYHGERLQPQHLLEIAARGFTSVELFATRSHFDYHDSKSVEALAGWLHDARLEMPSVHAPIVDSLVDDKWGRAFSTATSNADARHATIREMRAAIDIARIIPFRTLVVHLGVPAAQNPGPEDNSRDAALRSLEEIHRMADPLGIQIAVEVMDNRLSTAAALVEFVEEDLEGMNAGICMDVGHAFLLGDVTEAIETASGYLITTHLHDNRRSRDDHLVPFAGGIDWAAAMMAFEKIGYDGRLMFEIRNEDGAAAVLARAERARLRLQEYATPADLFPFDPSVPQAPPV
jgi:sugar phosphate isomerase/epimerase